MSLIDFLNSLFSSKTNPISPGAKPPDSGNPQPLPDSPDEPAQITNPKVLLLIYNPTVDVTTGKKLCEFMNWQRPDDIVGQFISDILQASGGLARYQIAQRLELDEFPILADGFQYTPQTYLDVVQAGKPAHNPTGIDYNAILKKFNILQRVGNNEFDEVWVMGFPYAGLYESTMGGAGAFWCNAPPLANTESCQRRFVIMGFSYEREVGEMLHSYNHRCESILARVYNCQDFLVWTYKANRTPATIVPGQNINLFERFITFDQIAPGKAAIGTVHYAPNGVKDYDLGNPNPVKSECYDWLKFPNFQGDIRMVTSQEWGGDEESYQQWWLKHMPKVAGRKNGIHNNWWQYIANPNNVIV
jgi:hypothetical protein